MTRNNSKPKAVGVKRIPAPRPASISGSEAKLDRLDRQLVKLVSERAELAVRLSHLKQEAGQPAFVLGHEEELLTRLAELNKGPLSNQCLRAIFREVISGSRHLVLNQPSHFQDVAAQTTKFFVELARLMMQNIFHETLLSPYGR